MKSNVLKKIIYNVKLILNNLNNYKYLKIKKSCGNNGIVLLVHESRRLGASILALNIAKELVSQGENVYIITKRFGELNSEFAKIAPIQVIWNTTKLKKTLNYLHNKHNFNKAIANTALMGSYAKIANEEGYKVISLIHELGPVIQQLHAEQETKYLLKCSSKVIFSTKIAKNEVLDLLHLKDNKKYLIKPQGVYYTKPSFNICRKEKNKLLNLYPHLKNNLVISGIGNTTFRKGFDIFLKVADELSEYQFIWAGKKENREYIKIMKKRQWKIPSNFTYLGELTPNQLSGVYSLTDILFLSSRNDTLPSVIFEAMLFGVPVVGAKSSGGISDVVDNSCGILTEKVNSGQFIRAIKKVATSKRYFDQEKIKEKVSNNSMSNYVKYINSLL